MRKNMCKILLLSAGMSLSLILSAGVAFAQCGADGKQPCGSTNKTTKKTTKTSIKSPVTKPKINIKKTQTIVPGIQTLEERLPEQIGRFRRSQFDGRDFFEKEDGAIDSLCALYRKELQIIISKFNNSAQLKNAMQKHINTATEGSAWLIKKQEPIRNGRSVGTLVILKSNYPSWFSDNKEGYLLVAYGVYLYRIYSYSDPKDAEEVYKLLSLN